MKRGEALLKRLAPVARRAALLNQARTPSPPKRGRALLKLVGVPKRMPVPYYNKKGRQFYLTLKGAYVLRQNGKTLYGRKAASPSAPPAIRRKIFSK